jgi:hypothetical protein
MPEEIVSRILRLPGYRVYASETEDASSILRLWVRPTAAEPPGLRLWGCGQAGRDVHVGLNGECGICGGAPGRCGSCWKCAASSVPDGPARAHSEAARPMSSSRSREARRPRALRPSGSGPSQVPSAPLPDDPGSSRRQLFGSYGPGW